MKIGIWFRHLQTHRMRPGAREEVTWPDSQRQPQTQTQTQIQTQTLTVLQLNPLLSQKMCCVSFDDGPAAAALGQPAPRAKAHSTATHRCRKRRVDSYWRVAPGAAFSAVWSAELAPLERPGERTLWDRGLRKGPAPPADCWNPRVGRGRSRIGRVLRTHWPANQPSGDLERVARAKSIRAWNNVTPTMCCDVVKSCCRSLHG